MDGRATFSDDPTIRLEEAPNAPDGGAFGRDGATHALDEIAVPVRADRDSGHLRPQVWTAQLGYSSLRHDRGTASGPGGSSVME